MSKHIKYLLLLSLPLIFTGCGKGPAPEPPVAETKLIMQIFKDLKEKQHESAANQLNRLVAIRTDNEFLYQLKTSELDNIYLDQVQQLVSQNKLEEAIELLKKAEIAQGRSKKLLAIRNDLTALLEIQTLVKDIEYPSSGTKLEHDANKLRNILKEYKPGMVYLPLLDERIKMSRKMQQTENHRALFSIYSDIAVARKNGDKGMAATLTAILMMGEPDRQTRDLADYVIQNYYVSADNR